MKKTVITLFFLFVYSSIYCQNDTLVTIIPQKPRLGNIVLITYNPNSKNAAIKNPNEMYMYWGIQNPDSLTRMQLKDGKWLCNFSLYDSNRSYIKFGFRSGSAHDMNNGKLWDFMIYDKNGTPLKDAYYFKSIRTSMIYDDDEYNTDSLTIEDLKKELFYYPDNFEAKMALYSYQIRSMENSDSIKSIAINEMEEKYSDKLNDKKTLRRFMSGIACQLQDFNSARKIRDKLAKVDPEYQLRLEIDEAAQLLNQGKKIELMEKYTYDFPNKLACKQYYEEIFDYYLNKNDKNNLIRIAENWIKYEKFTKSEVFNTIAYKLVEKNIYLDLALDYSQKSIDSVKNCITGAFSMRDSDTGIIIQQQQSTKEAKENRIQSLILSYKDTKGWIFYNTGKYQEARSLISEAYHAFKNSSEIGNHMALTFEKLGMTDSAFEVYKNIYINKYRDPELREKIFALYPIVKGNHPTDEMFKEIKSTDDLINTLDLKARENMVKDFRLKIPNQFVPKFKLQLTDNSIFDQEKLKNKITIIYYWNGLWEHNLKNLKNIQKVGEELKNIDNIQFITIYDNFTEDNVKEMILNFLNSNKIFLPTSIDKRKPNKKALKLSSFPTLLVIDRNGIIRYKKEGWGTEEDKACDIRFYIDEILKDKSN